MIPATTATKRAGSDIKGGFENLVARGGNSYGGRHYFSRVFSMILDIFEHSTRFFSAESCRKKHFLCAKNPCRQTKTGEVWDLVPLGT